MKVSEGELDAKEKRGIAEDLGEEGGKRNMKISQGGFVTKENRGIAEDMGGEGDSKELKTLRMKTSWRREKEGTKK